MAPLRDALRCVAPGRFVLRQSRLGLRTNTVYAVALNDMNSTRLKGPSTLSLVAGQMLRIQEEKSELSRERYQVTPISYAYGFTVDIEGREQELLTFHWDLDQPSSRLIPASHLHIGPGLLANPTVVRAGDFHNAHIPTGFIEFPAIVRFAIVDLGADPLTPAWQSILSDAESRMRTGGQVQP